MQKWIKILIVFLLTFVVGACSSNNSEYVTNEFDVNVDWDSINEKLDAYDFEKKGLYLDSDYKDMEASINVVGVDNNLTALEDDQMRISISYGATVYNPTAEDVEENGYRYYPEAMIQVQIWLPNDVDAYTVVYDTKGNVVRESGNVFMDSEEAQTTFCKEKALIMIHALDL